jgi:hypothetical protein
MGVCERMWGSKGSASWKVTVSSRRGVLYPIRVTLSCASLFWPSISTYVTVTLLFSSPSYRFLSLPTIWPFSSARPPTHLPSPFFFSSHGNSKFEGKGWIPPNQVLSPPLLRRPGYPARSLLLLLSPLHFSVTLSLLLSPGHLYLDLRIDVLQQQCVSRHRGTPMTPHRSRLILSFYIIYSVFCGIKTQCI